MAQMNEEQRAAFADLIHFLNDPNRKLHRLNGGAGTGKSFFISQVVDNVLKHTDKTCPVHSIAITATTNKAAAVLAEAIPHRAGEIGTIYSFMNLRVNENYTTGEVKVSPTPQYHIHHGTLIIIDECSMINANLWKYLMEGTSNTCKILFVGDRNQLAPVKEALSPVYTTEMSESNLTKPVRNAEQPALMELCEQCVDTVKTGVFHRIKEVPGVIDFVDGIQLKGIIEREYMQEDPSRRILSYTNARVKAYNQHIRQVRGYSDTFQVGEILTNNTACELVGKERLYTDQVVEVVEVGKEYFNSELVQGHDIPVMDIMVQTDFGATHKVTIFVDPVDRENVLKHFKNLKKWGAYFKIKNKFPDLRSIAASTTHKAQGSTYSSVVVDLADIGKSTNSEQTARMVYVALSRPKSRLYIRGQLPDRYFEEAK